MQNYHSARNKLPEGNRTNPRRVWVVYTWPYMEDQSHAALYDQKKHFYEPPNTITPRTLNGIYAKPVPAYYCASDRPGAIWMGDDYYRPGKLCDQLGPNRDAVNLPQSGAASLCGVCSARSELGGQVRPAPVWL